jgi:hypothetical protein
MRYLRIAMYALLGITAILVVAVIVVLTIDLGRFKPNVENLVSDLTGREFAIEGTFEPSLGRQIHLVAEDVKLAATDWSEYKELVSVRRIEVTVDTWSLISGPIRVETVVADGLRVHLEKNDDGVNNWTFPGGADDIEEPTEEEETRPTLPVLVDQASITDIRLTYDSPARPRPLDFVATELTEEILESDDLRIALTGALNETAITLESIVGTATNLLDFRDITFDLEATLGEIEIAGDGKFYDMLAPSRPEMHLRINGPGAEYMMQVLRREPFTAGPLSFDASLQPDGEQMALNVEGIFGEFDLMANGRFVNLQELHNIELVLEANGPDIGNVIRLAGGVYDDKDPFELTANIHRSGSKVAIEGIFLKISESNFHISGRFDNFPDVADAEVRLNISGPDFGRFNRLFGMPGKLGGPFTMVATLTPLANGRAAIEVESSAQDIQIRADADVGGAPNFTGSRMNVSVTGNDVSVIAKGAGFENAPKEKFEFTGVVERAEAGVILNNFVAIIGDDRFALDGVVGNEPLKSGTDLSFDFRGTNIRDTLQTFRIKADRLPVGPFRAVGRVERNDEHFVLENVRATIGAEQEYLLTADGIITNLTDFLGSRLKLGIRGNSLGALADLAGVPDIPDVTYDFSATVERLPESLRISNGVAQMGSSSAEIEGSIGDQPLQRNTDLRVRFSAPDLVYSLGRFGIEIDALPASELEFEGQFRNKSGHLSLRNLAISYAGMNAEIDGELGDLTTFEGTSLDVRVAGDDFSKLLVGKSLLASVANPYRAATKVRIRSGELELGDFTASLGNVDLAGEIAFGLDPLLNQGRFNLTSESPDLFQLFPKLHDISVPQVAPMRFSGAGDWQGNFWNFDDLVVNLGDGSLRISGSIDGPPDFDRTDLEFDWHISSLKKLSVLAGRELPDHSAVLRARLSGTQDQMTMEKFVGRIGDSDITGDFSMRGGDIPQVKIAFRSDRLDLGPYLPPLDGDRSDEPPPADGRLIPDTRLPIEILQKFDATVDITVAELIGRVTTVRDFVIDAEVDSGSLQVNKISFTGRRDGSLAGQLSIHPSTEGGADLSFSAKGSDLILGFQAKSVDDIQMLPLFELDMELGGRGETLRELAGSLDGHMRFVGGEGRINAGSMSLLTSDVITELVSTINPFVKSEPFTNVVCSAVLLQLDNGKVVGAPALVNKTDKLLIVANADINLQNERLRVGFNTIPQKGLGISLSGLVTPYVNLSGTLAKPSMKLNAESTLIEGGAAVATVGLSVLAKSLKNRFFSSKTPCGDAVERYDEEVAASIAAAQN